MDAEMANNREEVDFDFFDSPRSKDSRKGSVGESAARSEIAGTHVTDDSSERFVTSGKPPSHPRSVSRKSRREEHSGDSAAEDNDSPRSSTSANTSYSKRTIEAKIPSVTHDQDDERSADDSDDGERSEDRNSYSSAIDNRSSTRSITPSSQYSSIASKKKNQARDSDRASIFSKEDRRENVSVLSKADLKDGTKVNGTKKSNKKPLYLSDDSDTDESDVDVSDTDSDVTQVSPLNSPHRPSPTGIRKGSGKARSMKSHNPTSSNGNSLNFDQILSAHKDTLDLKLLLQAVIEMEKESSPDKSRRLVSKTAPQSGDFCRRRKNYSFTNDQILRIDRENQRLMGTILQKAREAKKTKKELQTLTRKQAPTSQPRPSSSAINRNREQQRIEAENLGILRRLQQTRPSKSLQRDVQINEYRKHLVFAGCAPLSSIQPRAKTSLSYHADRSYTDSMSELNGSSTAPGSRRQRPQSAFAMRPKSGKNSATMPTHGRPKSSSVKKERIAYASKDDDYTDDFEADEQNID